MLPHAGAIAEGLVTRGDLWVTSKVAFYPAAHDGVNAWVPIAWHAENRKGESETAAGVDLCLKLLGLDYVDLMLIHNPCTGLDDYTASSYPHCFELADSRLTDAEREIVLAHRFSSVKLDVAAAVEARAASWRSLEAARVTGKARFIGVSNYSAATIREMEAYATVMPAVDQLELHPRFANPTLRAYASSVGMALTAYGSGNSARIEARKSDLFARIATAHGSTPTSVVLQWTLQHGIAVIPRSATPSHIAANLAAESAPALSADEVKALDELNADHPYYWHPAPLFPAGTYVRDVA